MLGSHYEKKPLDLSKFYNPLPEAFPWLISCRAQHAEQQVLEVWRRKIWIHWYYLRHERQAGERPRSTDFSGPNPEHFTHPGDQSQDLHGSSSRGTHTERRRSWYPRLALGPSHETSPGPCAWMVSGETRGGATCPCMRLGDRQSVHQPQELKHFSEVFFWTVSSSIFPGSYIKCIRYLEKVGGKASRQSNCTDWKLHYSEFCSFLDLPQTGYPASKVSTREKTTKPCYKYSGKGALSYEKSYSIFTIIYQVCTFSRRHF